MTLRERLRRRAWLEAAEEACALHGVTLEAAFRLHRRKHGAARRAVYACLASYHGARSVELAEVFGRHVITIRAALQKERALQGLCVEKKDPHKPYTDGLLHGRLGERERIAAYLRHLAAMGVQRGPLDIYTSASIAALNIAADEVETGWYLNVLARPGRRSIDTRVVIRHGRAS